MPFKDSLTRWLGQLASESDRRNLRGALAPLVDRFSSQMTSTAGLVIKTGGSALAMSSASVPAYGVVKGVPFVIATSTDMPALTGLNITAASFNVFCFFQDAAGTKTVAMGTEALTAAGVVFPKFPEGKTLIGYILVTYASTFTGGSTPLDTATTVYVSPTGPFDPGMLV